MPNLLSSDVVLAKVLENNNGTDLVDIFGDIFTVDAYFNLSGSVFTIHSSYLYHALFSYLYFIIYLII